MTALTPEQAARACSPKRVRARSRSEAKRVARHLRTLFGHKLRPYHCRFCDAWHLTRVLEPHVPVYAGRRLVCYAARSRAARLTLALLERGVS